MNTYECPECGAEVEAADTATCPDCGTRLRLEPDAETVWRGESVKVRDHTKWLVIRQFREEPA